MIRAFFRQLLADHRAYQASHRLHMDRIRLDAIRRELAGLDDLSAELKQAEQEAITDLIESARVVNELINHLALATNNEMRKA